MGIRAGVAMCCPRDGGAGVLMSAAPSWRQPLGRGNQGTGGFSSLGKLVNRFAGTPVEQSGTLRRNHGWQVNVAADHSGSKPDAHRRRRKWGYHPLEELNQHEREAMQTGNGELSDADIARTVAEVNWDATIVASVVSDGDSVFGTDVHYIVDEHGVFYFEMDDDDDFMSNLGFSQTFTVLIGFGAVDEIVTHVFEDADDDEDEDVDLEDDTDDDEEEYNLEEVDIQFWEAMVPGSAEAIREELSPESLGSLGGWGGLETLTWVHPLEFSSKIAQAILKDPAEDFNKPTKQLRITGFVRKVTEEEEPYVHNLWCERFLWDEAAYVGQEEESTEGNDSLKEEETNRILRTQWTVSNEEPSTSNSSGQQPGKGDVGPKSRMKRPARALDLQGDWTLQQASASDSAESLVDQDFRKREADAEDSAASSLVVPSSNDKTNGARIESSELIRNGGVKELESSPKEGGDEGNQNDEYISEVVGTTFYKLVMISMELESSPGLQKVIEIDDFLDGQPDLLAHSSAGILERVNSQGSKTDQALKLLCKREKGLDVEEVTVSGVDCLGMELRVSVGIEVRTLRFQFNRKATCEKLAYQMIDQLLYPRPGHKRPRKSQQTRKLRR